MKMKLDLNKNKTLPPKTPTFIIALHDFSGERYDQLDIRKNELLIFIYYKSITTTTTIIIQ